MYWMNQGYSPFAPMGTQLQWMNQMRQAPVMPQQFPSMIDKWVNKPKYQPNAPTLEELFGGVSSPSDYTYQNSYAQPAQSSGAGRFIGLLGGK